MSEIAVDRVRDGMGDDLQPPSNGPAPPVEDRLANMLRGDQRLRWLQGQRIPAEAYLEHYPELLEQPQTFRALVLGEIYLRHELGESLDAADFERRFPEHWPSLRCQFDRLRPVPATVVSDSDEPDMAPVPWPVLPGYEIVEEIGRGGMGIVYKARQARLNRFVALKMLLTGPNVGARARSRFRAEAAATARLQHPNIVQIFDIIEQFDQLFLSLEYIGGGSLARRLGGQPRDWKWSAETVRLLARAVQYAHERRIVHRDLKPGNILVTADGAPKITDFGLAKRIDDDPGSTKTGTVLGTPDYMAPEQADGRVHEVGPATDIYALGVILYEMLTGMPPYRGEAMARILDAVRFQAPRPPRELRPETPRDLEAICLKCLEKAPADRYGSAGALAADLGRFLSGQPVEAGQDRRRRSIWGWLLWPFRSR
jgi:serine/threonine-protein kinase